MGDHSWVTRIFWCSRIFLSYHSQLLLLLPSYHSQLLLLLPLISMLSCTAHTHVTHRYCESNGLTEVTGDCLPGYYCTSGAILRNPVDQTYGDLCSAGHYCEEGSAWPEPCPTGTYYGAEVMFTE